MSHLNNAVDRRAALPGVVEILNRAVATLWLWQFRLRSRRELSRLDQSMLRDIGLDPFSRAREVAKPFWRE
ncbi:MAG: DUF1127 domain-containing protein [Inquilinus sp.]|nr:DUF1127 domain-containing protein [Inquilinus sp.]